jgi:hypothetical protein
LKEAVVEAVASAAEAEAAEASVTEAEAVTEVAVVHLVVEEPQEAEVPHEVVEVELVPEPRSSFNLTRDSKVSMSCVERMTLS